MGKSKVRASIKPKKSDTYTPYHPFTSADFKKSAIRFMIIYVICMIINIISFLTSNNEPEASVFAKAISTVLLSLANVFEIESLINIKRYPYFSILQLFFYQIFVILSDIILGSTITNAINNAGVAQVYSWIAFIILYIIFKKRIKNRLTSKIYKEITFYEKLKQIIFFERKMVNVPFWVLFAVACLTFTDIFLKLNSPSLEMFGVHTNLKVITAVALVLPSLAIAAQYTTTNLVYIFRGILVPFQVYTIILMIIRNNVDIGTMLMFTLETIVTVYIIYIYITDLRKEQINELEGKEEPGSI